MPHRVDPGQSADNAAGLDTIGAGVDDRLAGFLDAERARFEATDPALLPLVASVRSLLAAGGKRLRPAFVYWGHRATGATHDDAVYVPAAAVEMFHAFALIHDDVMDRAPTRRGSPSAHESFAEAHRAAGNVGDSDWFGVSAAVLSGDLAAAWSSQVFEEAEFPADIKTAARQVFTRLQVEVIAGQYLEMWRTGRPSVSESEALQISLLKSGRYTVTRPLQIGAALGSGSAHLEETLRRYGDALGVAFQLRDDILGLFGDPSETGKSTLDDVREGKRTLLIVTALASTDATGRNAIIDALGNPDATDTHVDRVRQVVHDTGALNHIESLVAARHTEALTTLTDLDPDAARALTELASLAVDRTA